ncbi:hypothetical protein JCM5353_004481 [Sporobolomyces roseus]
MPTSPSPDSTFAGKCVVCGEETWTRCSSCSSAGLDWMWFCSREHQKLIHPVHKYVCGSNAIPFHWPGLSQGEMDELVEASTTPGNWSYDLQQDMEKFSAKSQSDSFRLRTFMDVIKYRSGQGYTAEQSATDILVSLRVTLEQVRIQQVEPGNDLSQLRGITVKLFDRLAFLVGDTHGPNFALNSDFASWSTIYLHKLLIHLAIIEAFLPETYAGTSTDYGVSCMAYTLEALKEFGREVVAKTHPEEARKLIDGLAQS